jgi:protein-L-isoaspartate(D-aspartate) O-methyltransferase
MSSIADSYFSPDSRQRRERMVERQIKGRGVSDPLVLEAMRAVPREAFVPEYLARYAYEDSALPIESGQTISQPYIVAHMLEAAEIGPESKVLEIGTGSGYAAAVAARIAAKVYTIERYAALAETARERLLALGYGNVEVRAGDGTLGWLEAAPFDAILCAASSPSVPDVWRRQLALGGRLVMPLGGRGMIQKLVKLTRVTDEEFTQKALGDVVFVPLVEGES